MSESMELAALTPASMPRLFELAVEKGGVEALERLVALNERMMALAAKQRFAAAMAGFKAVCPPVPRRSESDQFKVTRNGIKVNRHYAAIEDIEATIRGPAGANGLSHRWGDAIVADGALTLPCIVSHTGGHSETSKVTLPLESRAGCSEAQKYGAVMAYAQRYSLIHAYGLTTCDEDTDAAPAEPEAPITPDQVLELVALIDRCPPGTNGRLLAYVKEQWGAATLDDLPASRFDEIKRGLEKKVAK